MTPLARCAPISSVYYLTHPPIALDVDAHLKLIMETMRQPPGPTKELLTIERGTATGKTTALEWVLREASLKWPDALCLGVCFYSGGSDIRDSSRYQGWEMIFAMGMVARMAGAVFGGGFGDAIYKALCIPSVHAELCSRKGEADAIETVASCVQYLLQRTGKSEFLLAVDELHAVERDLLWSCAPTQKQRHVWARTQQSNYDALRIMRHVLLDTATAKHSALLVSSLMPITLPTGSERGIRSLPVPSRLAPEEVLAQWWLVDCSKQDSPFDDPTLTLAELRATKPRKTIYQPADAASEQLLRRLATLADSLPDGLKHMKRQLDVEMKAVPAAPDGLKRIVMDEERVKRIYKYASEYYACMPRHTRSGDPSHSLIAAWLFQKPAVVADTTEWIRRSVFTNSVKHGEPLMLDACALSLERIYPNLCPGWKETATYIETLVKGLVDVGGVPHRRRHRDRPIHVGTPPEEIALRMLQVRLSAKVEDPAGARRVSIQELCYPDWPQRAEATDAAANNPVYSALVSLPDRGSLHFSACESVLYCRLNKDPVGFYHKLSAFDLTKSRFKVLHAAPGDCFDLGLLFVDAKTDKVCLWLGHMRSPRREGASTALQQLRTLKGRSPERAVATALQRILDEVQGDESIAVNPVGQALLEGRVLLSYLTTREGPGGFIPGDATRCDVTVVGREVARLFLTDAFFAYYDIYRPVAASAAKRAERKAEWKECKAFERSLFG